MAALFVGRRAGATAWRGAVMATVGLAGLLSLVGASDAQTLSGAQRVTVALVTAGGVLALMVAARAAHRHPAIRSVLLATGSGVAFGMSSVFTKTVAVDWKSGVALADVPSLAVIGVFATAGLLLSQASYRGAGLAAPLATLTVVNPVAAAAVGITMLGETFRYGPRAPPSPSVAVSWPRAVSSCSRRSGSAASSARRPRRPPRNPSASRSRSRR